MGNDEMQFGFMWRKSKNCKRPYFKTATGKIIGKQEEFVLCISRFGESFWRLLRDVVWCALRKLNIQEWLVWLTLNRQLFSDNLFVQVGKVISREIRYGCPEELVHADDLVLISETLKHLKERLEAWKRALGQKG